MHYRAREDALLAPYAMRAVDSAGRATAEADHPFRSPFQRDRDRITHCAAFRRLSQKTQVFTAPAAPGGIGLLAGEAPLGAAADYHRTRLTHTLEVASIARTIARALALNEDLVEALALAHDLGHPPFGHAGEALLDERLAAHGGFNHNRQALRIVERLETRYADRPGLNLTAEVLAGQRRRGEKPTRSETLLAPPSHAPGDKSPLLEEQTVDAADSIAYDSHDADDALEIGLVGMADLDESTLWRESAGRARGRWAALDESALRRATVHELIDRQVTDLVANAERAIRESGVASVAAARSAPPLVAPSPELAQQKLELEALLFRRVYRHPKLLARRREATAMLAELLEGAIAAAARLPEPFRTIASEESAERAAADWVASLTDRAVLAAPVGAID